MLHANCTDQITWPRLHRVTRGAHTLGTSMLCLWRCGSRGCISLLQGKDRADLLFSLPNPVQPFIVRDGQKTHVTHHVNKTREDELCRKKEDEYIMCCIRCCMGNRKILLTCNSNLANCTEYSNIHRLQFYCQQPSRRAGSFKVMGTIANQLKALSQNTPQSSIIL